MKQSIQDVTGWGLTAPARTRVVRVAGVPEILELLSNDESASRGLIPRGLGRSYGDAAQRTGGTTLAIQAEAGPQWLDLASGLVRVPAGVSIGDLVRFADGDGFFVPVTPGTRHVTIGGAIAADIHGKDHHAAGSFGMHVEAFRMITPGGELVSVSEDEDRDLFLATLGGMGLTGIVVDADVRMLEVPGNRILVDTFRTEGLDATMDAMLGAVATHRYSVAWVDLLAKGSGFGRGVVTNGVHTATKSTNALRDPMIGVPSFWNVGVVNQGTVRALNEVWFRKAPSRIRTNAQTYDQFFYPLDAIENWNRAYGPRGFLQYQLVVPASAGSELRAIAEALASGPSPVALAVLKTLGPSSGGFISFPMPGWTLTADLPVPKTPSDLESVLRSVDEAVVAEGGRVYLAKDSRLRGDLIGAMYPELDRFHAVRKRIDPDGVMKSDLAARLGL